MRSLPMLGGAIIWYGVFSLLALAAFAWDKRAARRSRSRIRERTLHTFELLGGFPGAWLGRALFHHKTRKTRYLLVLIGISILHGAVWASVVWWRAAS